jgi:hypothetical protein
VAADRSDDASEPAAKAANHSADQAEAPDVPSVEQSGHSVDRAESPADHDKHSRREQIEPRSREEAWTAALRDDAALEERTEPGARSNAAKHGQETPADASYEKTEDEPSARHPDHSVHRTEAPADDVKRPSHPPAEPSSREERSTDLRASNELEERPEPAGSSEPGARSKPGEPTENGHQPSAGDNWEETAGLGRRIWAKYKTKWPDEERAPVDRSEDPLGSWRSDSGRYLKPSDNERIDGAYNHIKEREETEITPALRAIESQDPQRQLVGFECRLKGIDRLKEKVCDNMNALELPPDTAVALVSDAIRFTFQYEDTRYARGVYADMGRLQEQGFKLEILKNYWSDDQYKGINSQWTEPVTGQRFEVQFHTRISYEAKQLTHPAYERLRTLQADELEELVLEAFQKKITAEVPVPPGAADIPDYPKRGTDAR